MSTSSITWAFIFFKNGGQRGIRTPEGVARGFTVPPIWPLWYLPEKKNICRTYITAALQIYFINSMEPLVGVEPTTIRLQGGRSTNWAKVAIFASKKARQILWKNRCKSNFFCLFLSNKIISFLILSKKLILYNPSVGSRFYFLKIFLWIMQ